MTIKRTPAAALVMLLVLAIATPAGADALTAARQRRDADKSKRAALASKIDALKASDAQLDAAVKALDVGVSARASDAEAAQQASRAAGEILTRAQARLATTNQQLSGLRNQAAGAALKAYVHPSGDPLLEIVRARDLSEASRRQALLAELIGGQRDVLDQLRVAREDQTADRSALARAQDLTLSRQDQAQTRLAALGVARAEQVRLRSALDARLADYTAEADALARDESSVESIIRAKEAQNSGDGGGGGTQSSAGFIWPLRGPVTSTFGMRWGRMHEGLDIAPGYGTPIHASKAGTVILAGTMGGYGNVVIISHGGGFSTLYAHQSRLAVSDGQTVSQGQVIGYVGSSGHSTGPHLHFEIRVNGIAQNPLRYLP